MKQLLKNWWNGLRFEPDDPRYLAGGDIKIAAIGGGTGLANLLRGLKGYSRHISAIVTVADNGSSTGKLREEFDMIAPGDIRKCISALAVNEELITDIFEYRFSNGNGFTGHTLGNIWLTGLTQYFGSFEKAVEATSELFTTAGKVLPVTLDNINLNIEYEDGTKVMGEHNLDEIVKKPKKISLDKKNAKAYDGAVEAIKNANMIIIGPGSLYGSIIPNLLIGGVREAIKENKKAVKVYIANCSTERTQTEKYSVDDHIKAIKEHTGTDLFNFCLVNNKVVRRSEKESKVGEVNNITTDKPIIENCQIVLDNVVNDKNPLYHDPAKLAKSLVTLYNRTRT